MACGNCGCGSSKTGDTNVKGCQSSGGCSSGGCNRMNVFNWLADIPLSDLGKPFPIVELSFNNGSRKDFFRNEHNLFLEKGIYVTVEGASGFDIGQVSLTGELVKLQMKKYGVSETPDMKRILRLATDSDLNVFHNSKQKEKEILIQSRAIAKSLNLEMKIAEAEVQADGKKICFFYTADARVDFRELIKVYATEFKAKIEMRQIGARQESAKVGGIGSCGRELCCSSWLTDFKTVNTTTARYQNLSINQAKLSGQCGRLKCCLNYELDTYMDALKIFPEQADQLELQNNRAFLIKKDIFRNLIWYGIPGSSRQYPVTIERVQEILNMNAKGEKPEDLGSVEFVQSIKTNNQKPVDVGFVNDVGQLTLSSLNKSSKKKNKNNVGESNSPKDRDTQRNNNKPNRNTQQPKANTPEGRETTGIQSKDNKDREQRHRNKDREHKTQQNNHPKSNSNRPPRQERVDKPSKGGGERVENGKKPEQRDQRTQKVHHKPHHPKNNNKNNQ
jgi:cell fate regulator YaaT (PSP1 superfamily)